VYYQRALFFLFDCILNSDYDWSGGIFNKKEVRRVNINHKTPYRPEIWREYVRFWMNKRVRLKQSDVEANITRKAIEGLPEKWRQRARFRAKSASYRAFEVLLHKPIITISILMKELKVSRQAATEASKQLVQRHVIRKREKRGREQVFAAEELISLLSRNFGTDVDLAMEAGYEVMKGDSIKRGEKFDIIYKHQKIVYINL